MENKIKLSSLKHDDFLLGWVILYGVVMQEFSQAINIQQSVSLEQPLQIHKNINKDDGGDKFLQDIWKVYLKLEVLIDDEHVNVVSFWLMRNISYIPLDVFMNLNMDLVIFNNNINV